MKVKPIVKSKVLAENELRVINIGKDAIAELLFENFMENQEKYFGVEIGDDTYNCSMNWNVDDETLTYAVVRIADIINKEIDFEKLFRNVGITTDSLFSPKCLASGCFVTVPLDRYTTPKPTPICKAP